MNTLRTVAGRGILVLLPALMGVGCSEEDSTPVASPELLETGAENVMFRLVLQITVNGIREGRVEADTAFAYPDSSVYSLRNPVLVLFDEQGRERARVESRRGRYNYATKELVAREDVVLTIPEGNRRVESSEGSSWGVASLQRSDPGGG